MESEFDRFKRGRDERQKALMLSTTARDEKLNRHPYAEYIPHVMIHWGMRQHVDQYELVAQWGFFTGMGMAVPFAHLKYGVCVTWKRRVRLGLKLGVINSGIGLLYVYFQSPLAQEPNRGTLQFNSWEQGYKNYIDKKYHLYDSADKDFFDIVTSKKQRKEILAQRNVFSENRMSQADQAYYN